MGRRQAAGSLVPSFPFSPQFNILCYELQSPIHKNENYRLSMKLKAGPMHFQLHKTFPLLTNEESLKEDQWYKTGMAPNSKLYILNALQPCHLLFKKIRNFFKKIINYLYIGLHFKLICNIIYNLAYLTKKGQLISIPSVPNYKL